jgi:hypothetical protein
MEYTTKKTWGENPLIKDLPIELQVLAVKNQIKQGHTPNIDVELCETRNNFKWVDSNEGNDFWDSIDDGNCPEEIPNPWPFELEVWDEKDVCPRKSMVVWVSEVVQNEPFIDSNGVCWEYAQIPQPKDNEIAKQKKEIEDIKTWVEKFSKEITRLTMKLADIEVSRIRESIGTNTTTSIHSNK